MPELLYYPLMANIKTHFKEYFDVIGDSGVCFGLAAFWTQACWAGDEASFRERLTGWLARDLLKDPIEINGKIYHDFGDIIRDYEELKKNKKYNEYTPEERTFADKMLDTYAFFDTLILYHSPERTFLDTDIPVQSLKKIFPYVQSLKISPAGTSPKELNCVYAHPWAVTPENPRLVMDFLAELDKLDASAGAPTLFLNSMQHAIAITKIDGKWQMFDQNYMSTKKFYREVSAKAIRHALRFDVDPSAFTGFNMEVYISPLQKLGAQASKIY
jgi:hypothetical protein